MEGMVGLRTFLKVSPGPDAYELLCVLSTTYDNRRDNKVNQRLRNCDARKLWRGPPELTAIMINPHPRTLQ